MEHACEADVSISNREVCCFGKIVVCYVVTFSLSWVSCMVVVRCE
jgi:hypothetical protein